MDFDKYINQLSYPSKEYEWCFMYRGEVQFKTNSQEQALKYQKEHPTHIKDKYEINEENYKKLVQEYNQEEARIHRQFEEDLFEYYGVQDNPKRHRCYSMAWDMGHAYGFSEVWNTFGNIVDLIQD